MACLAEETIACTPTCDEELLAIRHLDDPEICVLPYGVDRRVSARDTGNQQYLFSLQWCQCSSAGLNNWVLLLVVDSASACAGLFGQGLV